MNKSAIYTKFSTYIWIEYIGFVHMILYIQISSEQEQSNIESGID